MFTVCVLYLLELCTLIALIGGAVLLVRTARTRPHAEQLALIAILALALALRLYAPASPHDIYSRNSVIFWDRWPTLFDRGLGFPAFARTLEPIWPAWWGDESWIFFRVAWIGAASSVLLAAWLWVLEAPTLVALGAALLFALASPHVRLSHTDAQQIPALGFALIGALAWSQHNRRPSWLTAMVTATALTCAGAARIECLLLPVVVSLCVLADTHRTPWRHPATRGGIAVLIVALGLHTAGLIFGDWWTGQSYGGTPLAAFAQHEIFTYGLRQLVIFDPAYTSPVIAVLSVFGAFLGPLTGRVRGALAVSALALSLVVPMWSPAGGEAFALSRYQVAAAPFALALSANGLAGLLDMLQLQRPGRVGGFFLAVAATASVARLPLAMAPSTLSAEYAFIRSVLPTLPPNCEILYEAWDDDQGLWFPYRMPELLGLPLTATELPKWSGSAGDCTLYYRGATCAIERKDAPLCSRFHREHALDEIKTSLLPSRQWVYDRYPQIQIHVGFYRLAE